MGMSCCFVCLLLPLPLCACSSPHPLPGARLRQGDAGLMELSAASVCWNWRQAAAHRSSAPFRAHMWSQVTIACCIIECVALDKACE
jgi:hypothetical protein